MSEQTNTDIKVKKEKIRNLFYTLVLVLIIVKGDVILHQWLGFGDGKKVSNLPNVLLNALWTGGLAIVVIQCLVWVETLLQKLTTSKK